jgi:hypothetical protein
MATFVTHHAMDVGRQARIHVNFAKHTNWKIDVLKHVNQTKL